jgi:hypothetical protein
MQQESIVCCVAKLGKSVASRRIEGRGELKERACRLWVVCANRCPVSHIPSWVRDIQSDIPVTSRWVFCSWSVGSGDREEVRELRRSVRAMRAPVIAMRARVGAKHDCVGACRSVVATIPNRVSRIPEPRSDIRTRVKNARTCVMVIRRRPKTAVTL